MRTQSTLIQAIVGVLLTAPCVVAAAPTRPVIQIAILLDTSNSMDGLIDQAKTQLWKVVNEVAAARQAGAKPELQVALFEYGNNGLSAAEGWIRLVLPLSTDLDKVSEELFALRTNGGEEYCGTVIRDAVARLAWSASPKDFKAVFIAGNEPFTQGKVDYRESCRAAVAKGIVVNTIFCGDRSEGINTHWKDGADIADGRYMSIDQNHKPIAIDAPQDGEIARLGAELNTTYIPFGAAGSAGKARQQAQDSNAAAAAPAVNAERQVAKAQAHYSNTGWDLVDARKGGTVKLDELKAEELPNEMQKLNEAERRAYVDQKAKQRDDIQKKIQKLSDKRKHYIAEQMKKQQLGADTLDAALVATVHDEATTKGFTF